MARRFYQWEDLEAACDAIAHLENKEAWAQLNKIFNSTHYKLEFHTVWLIRLERKKRDFNLDDLKKFFVAQNNVASQQTQSGSRLSKSSASKAQYH